jgi:hypothetical protein
VFDYDPRFSILDYRVAGLKPLLHAFPHFANALMENGMDRCERCACPAAENPPLFRAHFRRPLRVPTPLRTIATLNFVLPHKPASLAIEIEAVAFESSEAPETKCSKIERLFELAVTDSLLVCAPHRADASTATQIGKTLGRTQAEQFTIERFFALGFRNGAGNEPWLETVASESLQLDPDKVKKARNHFGHWKKTALFFLNTGQPQAADFPGARIRQEALQPTGSDLFLALLNTQVYAPLMSVFVAADAQGRWLIGEPELHVFARCLNGGMGKVLLQTIGAISRCADSFHDPQSKCAFLFECAVGIVSGATGGNKNPRRLAMLERAKDVLRKSYEQLFAVSLSAAPSVLRSNPADTAAQLVETKKRFEEAEQRIISLLVEPFSRNVSEQLRETLAVLHTQTNGRPQRPVPRIQVESQTTFEESVTGLCAWIKSKGNQAASASLPSAHQWLATMVELRALVEEAHTAEALEKARTVHPTLSETQKQALAPFFGELSWSLLQAIEQQRELGNIEQVSALAEGAMRLIEGTPSRDQFKSLLQQLFAPKAMNRRFTPQGPSIAASAPEARGPRAHRAEELLRVYADELSLDENQLEQEFLEAVRDVSEAAFKRKEKLRNRLQRRTRWGGREPYKTTLKLLESVAGG